jgi:hypothetical protein
MSSVQTTASTPRSARINKIVTTILLVFGAAVLAAGISYFAYDRVSGSGSSASSSATPQASSHHNPSSKQFLPPKQQPLPKIKYSRLSPDVRAVVKQFMLTAVPRKNLQASWDITAPALRQGYTRKSWAKGNIPITMFPVYNYKGSSFQVVSKTPNEIHVYVGVAAPPKLKMRPVVFDVGLHKFGSGSGAHWMVDYFLAHYTAGMYDANS